MFSGSEIAQVLTSIGITHVVTVPDSTIGPWDESVQGAGIRVVRVCREGEAWTIAGGLHMGGAKPFVMIQCTGLFESGDAIRNMLHEWKLPLYGLVGYRSYLNQTNLPGDTSLVFTEPMLALWKFDVLFVKQPEQLGQIAGHYRACMAEERSGVVLLAEGRG